MSVHSDHASYLPHVPQTQDILMPPAGSLAPWLSCVGGLCSAFSSVYLGILPLFIKYYYSVSLVFCCCCYRAQNLSYPQYRWVMVNMGPDYSQCEEKELALVNWQSSALCGQKEWPFWVVKSQWLQEVALLNTWQSMLFIGTGVNVDSDIPLESFVFTLNFPVHYFCYHPLWTDYFAEKANLKLTGICYQKMSKERRERNKTDVHIISFPQRTFSSEFFQFSFIVRIYILLYKQLSLSGIFLCTLHCSLCFSLWMS